MIKIFKNPNGDTRTAPKNVTFEEFQEANNMHIDDVKQVMYELSQIIDHRGENHDCTKKSQERMFYNNFLSTMNDGTDFVNDEWYQLHIKAERHHLLSNCPDDVNLIDVLEMIADGKIDVEKLITRKMNMKYAKRAIEMHRDGEAIKILLEN